ncbi:DUF6228 family protein [Microbulbifer sp. GL-2]|uniref:DUF6228 family protein n=1 Tax=Microbulbifer sp. GL-2 TaxID=2591606 RepID=UPI001163800B|nr:DUF6228 family protein [Microbulbifer sp. GL-2]BBM02437.1 hypothetical protein GL2_25110 [Microbulbifer sp. GL-2]
MDKFLITSSSSNEQFIFSQRDGEFFRFEVVGEAIRATGKVSTYTDEFGIANLFTKVSELESTWDGAESWKSLEGEFEITLTCNSTGHVTIQVKLTQWNGGSEDWHIIVHLNTELGQLQKVAGEARAFFSA